MFELLPVAENEGRSACTCVADKRIKCKIDGVPVSNCAQRQMGPSLSKRWCMTTPEILEMASKTHGGSEDLKSSGREQAQWAMLTCWRIWCRSRADPGVNRMTGRAPGGVGFQYQGHRRRDGPVSARGAFHEGAGDGKAGRAGRV